MSENSGWVAIWRTIQDHWVWQDPRTAYQWVDLILLANHEDVKARKGSEVVVFKRGTVNRSIRSLAERWHCDAKTATRFIDALEADGMITTVRNGHGSTITLVNYDVFQNSGSQKGALKGALKGAHEGALMGALMGDKQQLKTINNNDNKAPDGAHIIEEEPEDESEDEVPEPQPQYQANPERVEELMAKARRRLFTDGA